MKRLTVLAVVMALLIAGGAWADKDGMPVFRASADVVKVSATPAAVSAVAGERVAFAIKLDITKRWHIYTHGDSNAIGVDLVPDDGFALEDFKAEYPHGHEGVFFGDEMFMIEGKEVINASALVPADLPKGEHSLSFSLTAQASSMNAVTAKHVAISTGESMESTCRRRNRATRSLERWHTSRPSACAVSSIRMVFRPAAQAANAAVRPLKLPPTITKSAS